MYEKKDILVGFSAIFLGLFMVISSFEWITLTQSDPAGPSAMPMLIGSGIVITGGIISLGALLNKNDKLKFDSKKFTEEYRPIIYIILVSLIFIFILPYLGYLFATPLLIGSILWILAQRDKLFIIKVSIGSTLVLFLIFFFLLQVKLPLGFLEPLF